MNYVAHITVPVVFHADTDLQAQAIVELLRCHLADVSVTSWLPADAAPEVSDYPDATLQDVLPYETPRVVDVS